MFRGRPAKTVKFTYELINHRERRTKEFFRLLRRFLKALHKYHYAIDQHIPPMPLERNLMVIHCENELLRRYSDLDECRETIRRIDKTIVMLEDARILPQSLPKSLADKIERTHIYTDAAYGTSEASIEDGFNAHIEKHRKDRTES